MGNEEILLQNIKEYYKNAIKAKNDKEFNTAVTLFFKAIASLCDLYILKKEGFLPSNHTQRFRVLETKYSNVYKIIDADFSLYQDSYKIRLDKISADILEKDVKRISEITGIRI